MPEERKLVTVLFADVTGSTALGEDLDPEDVRALMGRYYDHARQVVSDHGGTLEKFIGDAVMAVFGLPHAHGDDADRAVAAALALYRAVAEDAILRDQVTLRVGVNTGEVVATSDPSSGDFLVTGDAVNVAARLQQYANPGEILTSERTEAATQAGFLFGVSREVEVKGKREPLRTFPVAGARPSRQVQRPPLVGRKRELAHLSMLQSWAQDEHRPQLVSIVASAGTGKTRLLEEFLAQLDPVQGWRVAVGRCLPYGQTLTYWPLRGLLEDLVGGIERDRVAAAFRSGGYGHEDASRLADLALAPLGIESEGLTERESIFNAWRLLIETLAKDAPRIVVFEDLHWTSDSLLDLVEHVMHPRTKAPLLLIAISRPELLDRRPTWGGGGRQNFTALVLEPLSEVQTAELVDYLGGMLPEVMRQRIVERCGGNPFFATELVRGTAERGVGKDSQVLDVVPDTVHGAVLARLDALSPAERSVAQAAAVAGRSFRPSTLAAVLGDLRLVEINAAIEGLVARDLVVPGEGDAYTFRHVLIRDVAYGTLSRAERIRMHAAVAAWFEQYAAGRLDEFVELIAYHYREAVMLSRRSTVPLALSFDPTRAITFLERAGELATRAGAFVEGQDHLQRAIELAAAEEQAQLYEKLGDCGYRDERAIEACRKAVACWRVQSSPDPLVGARLMRKILMYTLRWLDAYKAREMREDLTCLRAEAERLAEEAGAEDELWRLRVADCWWHVLAEPRPGLGFVHFSGAEAEQRKATALAAAAYFEEREDWESFSTALDGYGGPAMLVGAHHDTVEASRRRLAAPGLPLIERGDAMHMVAWGHYNLGEYGRAIEVAQQTLAQLRPGDSALHLAGWLGVPAAAAQLSGRWDDLSAFITVATDAWEQASHDARSMFVIWGYFEALRLALAREDRATRESAATVLDRILPADAREGLAWLAALLEDDTQRLDLDPTHFAYTWQFIDALSFLSERGVAAPLPLLEAARVMAREWKVEPLIRFLAIAEALAADDAKRLRSAIDEAKQHGLIPHAARMRIVLAQMTGDAAPLDQARPVLERLGDHQFLRRLEEVAASLR